MSDLLSPHKQHLFSAFILENRDVEWIREGMRKEHGIDASKSHYESKFRQWDFRKNFKVDEDWPWIDFVMTRLDRENRQGELYFRGVLVPREKVRNQLQRYQAQRYGHKFSASPDSAMAALDIIEPPKPAGFCVYVPREGSAGSSPSDDEEALLLAYSDQTTAFLAAAAKGYIHTMTRLIARGVDLNCKNADGLSPIHLVAMLDTQLDTGILPISRPSQSDPCSPILPRSGIAKSLTQALPSADRYTSSWSEILTSLLLQAGADVNARTKSGQTALVIAVRDRAPIGLVKCLLEAGADPLLKVDGMAAVHFATLNADLPLLSLLLTHPTAAAQVNSLCIRGHTPLDYTRLIEWDHRPILRLIRQNGGRHGPEVWPKGWSPVML